VDTFAAIMLMPFKSVPKIHVWKDEGEIDSNEIAARGTYAYRYSSVLAERASLH
jgi:hypothetical protein